MLNVILYPWSDCAIYSGHFIEISIKVEKSHWHHVVSVTLTSKRCNFKIKPQICISTWVLLNIKCFGCPWIFFWGIHGWHDVSVTCCQHEFVSKGCFELNLLLVHVSIHNNNWSKCLLKLKRPIWKYDVSVTHCTKNLQTALIISKSCLLQSYPTKIF